MTTITPTPSPVIYGILHYFVDDEGHEGDPAEEIIDELGPIAKAAAIEAAVKVAKGCGPVGKPDRGYREVVDLVELEGAGPFVDSDGEEISPTHAPQRTVLTHDELLAIVGQKTRTITLTGRAPVKIVESEWPIIASATSRSATMRNGTPVPEYETDGYSLHVRQHADGRTIVYGVFAAATAWTGSEDHRGGQLLDAGADIAAAIREVGEECGIPDGVIRECIADLPAEEI